MEEESPESGQSPTRTISSESQSKIKMTKKERSALVRERLITLHKIRDPGVPRVCIDLSFGRLMTSKELSSLACQVRQVYGANRRAADPLQLWLTSLDAEGDVHRTLATKNDGFADYVINKTSEHYCSAFPSEDIVYLTPDSPNILSDMEDKKVYIIGGLVDGTVLPSTTYDFATARGIQTAKLPISTVMKPADKGTFSPILTINQVFEILLHYYTTRSWHDALSGVVPRRKGLTLR